MTYYELTDKSWWIRHQELVKIYNDPIHNGRMIERLIAKNDKMTRVRTFYDFKATATWYSSEGYIEEHFEFVKTTQEVYTMHINGQYDSFGRIFN